MVYLETKPSPGLAGWVRTLWYTCAPEMPHKRERVLPNGCAQLILSLATETLTNCALSGDEETRALPKLPGAILLGARSSYDVIATCDLRELVGVIFRPGGLGPWLRQPADAFYEQAVGLEDVWGRRDARERVSAGKTPLRKLEILDRLLRESARGRAVTRRPMVLGALQILRENSVRQTARSLGVSERRLLQVFREDVGLSPKLWSRVQRFQRAAAALHSGRSIRWEQLALNCGYYDQSHLSNDFRAFSGIDPTTYYERRGCWRNHRAVD